MARLVLSSAVLTLAVLACAQRIEWDDPPPALYLTFTNLPARWKVEATKDMTNWFSIILSGEAPPGTVSLQLTNGGQAQFYRLTERP